MGNGAVWTRRAGCQTSSHKAMWSYLGGNGFWSYLHREVTVSFQPSFQSHRSKEQFFSEPLRRFWDEWPLHPRRYAEKNPAVLERSQVGKAPSLAVTFALHSVELKMPERVLGQEHPMDVAVPNTKGMRNHGILSEIWRRPYESKASGVCQYWSTGKQSQEIWYWGERVW